MKKILAFGDSNTWGYRADTGTRYPSNIRWSGLLKSMERCAGHVQIIEKGLCGRTTVFGDSCLRGIDDLPSALEKNLPLDGLIIMLGTNDCKAGYNASPSDITSGMEACVDAALKFLTPDQILVISPINLGKTVWMPDKDPAFTKASVDTCRLLKPLYRSLSEKLGTGFLAASDFAFPGDTDEEHLEPEGHRLLASAIYNKLIEMKLI